MIGLVHEFYFIIKIFLSSFEDVFMVAQNYDFVSHSEFFYTLLFVKMNQMSKDPTTVIT